MRSLNVTYRKLQRLDREELEKDLTFVGFLIMENKLKAITNEVIERLQHANIRTVMVTGDNAMTAISVGRHCNIIRPDMRVYLGDLHEDESDETAKGNSGGDNHQGDIPDNEEDTQYIEWKDLEDSERFLDEDNLEPVGGIAEFLDEDDIPEIQDEKELFDNASREFCGGGGLAASDNNSRNSREMSID